ncbi:MAG: hypothetical protein KDD67_11195 [Ignavibacteriae bacterium]|nr:hypothetical protein [Ignavibacteriota bacterium]MCB9215853.1 hypothetical protein [Ignavibacteria bacterium]
MYKFLAVCFTTLLLSCSSEPSTPLDTNPIDTTQQNDTTSITDTTKTTDSLRVGLFDGDTAEGGNCIWVAPYYRTDGTCVRGHWTSAPGTKCSLVGKVYVDCD